MKNSSRRLFLKNWQQEGADIVAQYSKLNPSKFPCQYADTFKVDKVAKPFNTAKLMAPTRMFETLK